MANQDYYKKRNEENLKRIHSLLLELPIFCGRYFNAVETTTSSLTRLNYAYDLRIFFFYLTTCVESFKCKKTADFTLDDLKNVSSEDIEMFLSFLSHYTYDGKTYTNENSGKARKLSSVRAFFKYFYCRDLLEKDVASKISMPKIKEKEIVRLEVNEIADLLDEAEDGNRLTARQMHYHKKTKLRDVALLSLFLGTGIRISELVGLNLTDFDFNNNAFTVTRKGGKRVILYFSNEVASALINYIAERTSDKKIPPDEQALFLSIQNRRISTKAVQDLVKKYSSIVTPLKHITPHKMRSTYGTELYRATGDIYVVAEVLGHRDVNTTKKHYAALGDDIRREAAKKVVLREDDK
jgi:site-specific recombinase XerD